VETFFCPGPWPLNGMPDGNLPLWIFLVGCTECFFAFFSPRVTHFPGRIRKKSETKPNPCSNLLFCPRATAPQESASQTRQSVLRREPLEFQKCRFFPINPGAMPPRPRPRGRRTSLPPPMVKRFFRPTRKGAVWAHSGGPRSPPSWSCPREHCPSARIGPKP